MPVALKKYPESYSDKNVVGRTKHFTINGIRFNSSWEYKVSLYLEKNNIKWQRKGIKPVPYYWNNDWHLYFPDFLLTEYDTYLEVKGYETDRDLEKWKQSDKPILIIKQKEIDLIEKNSYNLLLELKLKTGIIS